MVPSPRLSSIASAPRLRFERSTKKSSSGSIAVSPLTEIVSVRLVWPGVKVSVPWAPL
jgi:hypothetical protein